MVKSQNKLRKEDLQLLELLKRQEETQKGTSVMHNYIFLPIDRKYIGMTRKERELLMEKKVNEK